MQLLLRKFDSAMVGYHGVYPPISGGQKLPPPTGPVPPNTGIGGMYDSIGRAAAATVIHPLAVWLLYFYEADMNEGTKILDIIEVATPTDAPLTIIRSENSRNPPEWLKIPNWSRLCDWLRRLCTPSTPATLKGLVQLLCGLMQMSSKAKASHHKSITTILSELDAIPDTNLTLGMFLCICRTIMKWSGKTQAVANSSDFVEAIQSPDHSTSR